MKTASAFVALVLAATPLAAQGVVAGTVTDSARGRPLAGAEVLTAGRVMTTTDSAGRFLLRLPAGGHDLAARWVGFQPAGVRIQVRDGDTVVVAFQLSGAQRLPTLNTTAGAPRAIGTMAGFEERRKLEFGSFLTREMLEGQEHRRLSNVMQDRAPGVRFYRYENETIATGRGRCAMAVWVDGIRIYAGTATPLAGGGGSRRPNTGLSISSAASDGPPNIDNFRPGEIEAIEVYAGPGRTPMEFQLTGSACGTILIWTRVGGGR